MVGAPGFAHSYAHNGVHIGHAWAQPVSPSRAWVFFPIVNQTTTEDKLLGVSTPFAKRAQMIGRNGAVDTHWVLAPKGPLAMRAGGRFILVEGLKAPLKKGDHFPLTLVFSRAGRLTVDVVVDHDAHPPH